MINIQVGSEANLKSSDAQLDDRRKRLGHRGDQKQD